MPDVLHWLGVTRIHRFASMSDMKCDALIRQGIAIDERVPIPDDLVPDDARVEIEAKIAAGYFAGDKPRGDSAGTVGRDARRMIARPLRAAHRRRIPQSAARRRFAALLSADAVRERCRDGARLGRGRAARRTSRSTPGRLDAVADAVAR